MWKKTAEFILKNRIVLLILLGLATVVMAFFAAQVKLSYDFSKSIPTNNDKYVAYQEFKKKFGDDGNTLVVGVEGKDLFQLKNFNEYKALQQRLKLIPGVEDIVSVPSSVNLVKDTLEEKLTATRIFADSIQTQEALDSTASTFLNLPFYKYRLYNPDTKAYLMALRINKQILASKERTGVVSGIQNEVNAFSKKTGMATHLSGLPLIRTVVADMVQKEMKMFLLISLGLSTLILLLFFRSLTTTLMSLAVVLISVIWTVAVIVLMGYQITLLTALIPSLVVVIGIPNCIYFLNKYHSAYLHTGDKNAAIVEMISKMGIVTLFCNIAAAIGFAVFAFTKSDILKEFGAVAGVSIMLMFTLIRVTCPAVSIKLEMVFANAFTLFPESFRGLRYGATNAPSNSLGIE